MDHKKIWKVGEDIVRSLRKKYVGSIKTTAKQLDLKPEYSFLLLTTYTFQPNPVSIELLRVERPYLSPSYYRKPLEWLFKNSFLVKSSIGGYYLTDKGHEAMEAILCAAYTVMQEMSPLPKNKIQELATSLGRLVQNCLTYNLQIPKWSLIHLRRLDKAPPDSHIAKVDQYLNDLSSYRVDSHLASWRHYGIPGHAWDILTILWKNRQSSLGSITNHLSIRGWSESEMKEAVESLQKRGWIEQDERLEITNKGLEIRNKSEEVTDAYFFEPWDKLPEHEMELIGELLPQLKKQLAGK